MNMLDHFDQLYMLNKQKNEGNGEDSFFGSYDDTAAIVCVMDGSGGLGSMSYHSMGGKTGAFLASRTCCDAVRDWYFEQLKTKRKIQTDMLKEHITRSYRKLTEYAKDKTEMKGDLIRDFPTTLACALLRQEKRHIVLHAIWAGDSRVYQLCEEGLMACSIDDSNEPDAFEALYDSPRMTNVLSSDGKYTLHHKKFNINGPCLILAATDGCFDCFYSPMHFEHAILEALLNNNNPNGFEQSLRDAIAQNASDDFTLGIMSVGYGDYTNCQKHFRDRYHSICKNYMDPIYRKLDEDGSQDEKIDYIQSLWASGYKQNYEILWSKQHG